MARLLLQNNKKGFTLLEVIVALGVLMIALAAILSLATGILRASQASRNEFIAANLAQEAIEVVRSVRDSNWLACPDDQSAWLLCSNNPVHPPALIGAHRIEANASQPILVDSATPLVIDTNGYYGYAAGGKPTLFKRSVTVTETETAKTADVAVVVSWQTSAGPKSLNVNDRLTNWR